MKKLTFEQMMFSRASDAWCPITGRAVGPNTPRVVPDRILASVGEFPIYYRFSESLGYCQYSNEVGCYTRAGETTHVYTDELDAMCTRLSSDPLFARISEIYEPLEVPQLLLSEDGRPLEYLRYGDNLPEAEHFVVTTLIHGNEADGILGTLRAFEILCTHPDFAALRDRYVINLLPCCNPDGYYNGRRNLSKYGPHHSGVDKTINMNRVWPWYWAELVPTEYESKGDAPITCSNESKAINAWRSVDAPRIAWLLDQHSTAGDGARYQSRDRNFRDLGEDEHEKLWADWTTIRLLKSVQARRVQEGPNPDLWVNYFRSRWRPHWHSYISTLPAKYNGNIQAVSIVGEHNKVSGQVVTSDLETYKSASDFNLDHVLALAWVAQGSATERKTAVFVEHEQGNNLFENTEFDSWRSDEYRPNWWTSTRMGHWGQDRTGKHMQTPGRALQLTPDTILDLGTGYSDLTWGSDIGWSTSLSDYPIILLARIGSDDPALYTWDVRSAPVYAASADINASGMNQWRLGVREATAGGLAIEVVGLGDSFTGIYAVHGVYTYTSSTQEWDYTHLATHTTPLDYAGVATDGFGGHAYIFGGLLSGTLEVSPVFSQKILAVDDQTGLTSFTEIGTDLLDVADGCMECVRCASGALEGKMVLVGGQYDGTLGLKIRVFNPNLATLDVHYASMSDPDDFEGLAPSVRFCGVVYDGTDTLWIYGGENPSTGHIYSGVWTVRWNGTGFDDTVLQTLDAGLSNDGDPEDYDGNENWDRRIRYWRGLRVSDPDEGTLSHMLFGGVEEDLEADVDERRGFWGHYLNDSVLARPAMYDFGYTRYNTGFEMTVHQQLNTSWSYKAASENRSRTGMTSSYVRINNASGSDALGVITSRRVRTYYMHPPKWWFRDHASIDLRGGKPSRLEDKVRCYIRGYRQNQAMYADSPMLQMGTLWPSSWSPYGMTREAEVAEWVNLFDQRFFRFQFDFLPAASFLALMDTAPPGEGEEVLAIEPPHINLPFGYSGVRLLTLGFPGMVGIPYDCLELWAAAPDAFGTREYVRGQVLGHNQPGFLLRKANSSEDTFCFLPVYWGGHVKDTAVSRFDTPVQIQIWQHALYGYGLSVKNGWTEGWVKGGASFSPASPAGPAYARIHGGGWWSEPEALPLDKEWKNKYVKTENPSGALLVGDRDPTYGQISFLSAFKYEETFIRSDSTNLGDNWRIISQTGNGFDIVSNQARCSQRGVERWTAYPYVSDCTLHSYVNTPNGNKVGLCTRMHWSMAVDGYVHGYIGYLECTGATTGTLILERHFWNAGVQDSMVLKTLPILYDESTDIYLYLKAEGTTITLGVDRPGVPADELVVVDANHPYPGTFGIYGETTGSGSYVYVNSLWATPKEGAPIRITE